MNKKKLTTKLSKAVRKTYELSFIDSIKLAKAYMQDRIEALGLETYYDGYDMVYLIKNKQGINTPFTLYALKSIKETIERNRAKQYQCFVCRKHYQNEKKAVACCNRTMTDEEDDWELPRKTIARKPVASTHTCPNVQHGGKSWSVWLQRGETCPMCQYTYLPC